MKKIYLLLFAMANVLSVTLGQNTYFKTEISSFGKYDMTDKTYYILPCNPNLSANDLEFIYYRDIIRQVMVRHKAIYTHNLDSADVCILLDYAITDESYIATTSVPVWGRTGIASVTTTSRTTGNVYGNVNSYGSASAYSTGNTASANTNVSTYGNAYGSSTTTTTQNYNYNYGVTGYREETYKVNQYLRVLHLYAYDNKIRQEDPIMLWKTSVYSDGSSDDLHYVFPYLANVANHYIGKNTNGKKTLYIYDNNPDVLLMKEQHYLRDDGCVNPKYKETINRDIKLRVVNLLDGATTLALLAWQPSTYGNAVKFKENTYIIYKGQKILLERLNVLAHPLHVSSSNLINKNIYRQEIAPTLLVLRFPVEMKKGESFDFYSFFDKKEKKPYIVYEDIMLE